MAVGSAIYVGLSVLMDHESSPTRIAAQIVSGLGFLGGGVIMREGFNVRGLNTAAAIWCSGAVGSLAGGGFIGEAAIGTSVILLVNVLMLPVSRWIDSLQQPSRDATEGYSILIECVLAHASGVRAVLLRHIGGNPKLALTVVEMNGVAPHRVATVAHVVAVEPDGHADHAIEQIVAHMSLMKDVTKASWEQTAR